MRVERRTSRARSDERLSVGIVSLGSCVCSGGDFRLLFLDDDFFLTDFAAFVFFLGEDDFFLGEFCVAASVTMASFFFRLGMIL